jgi:hypothetical protein
MTSAVMDAIGRASDLWTRRRARSPRSSRRRIRRERGLVLSTHGEGTTDADYPWALTDEE